MESDTTTRLVQCPVCGVFQRVTCERVVVTPAPELSTGTIRENVQRLGRLLRKQKDKQAILYEIVAQGTTEEYASERRRQHQAFRSG